MPQKLSNQAEIKRPCGGNAHMDPNKDKGKTKTNTKKLNKMSATNESKLAAARLRRWGAVAESEDGGGQVNDTRSE